MFFELMQAMQDALSALSPASAANKARSAVGEKTLRASKDPVVTQVERTGQPAMTELWEIMTAETRTHVEAEIQCWTPPKRGQVRFVFELPCHPVEKISAEGEDEAAAID